MDINQNEKILKNITDNCRLDISKEAILVILNKENCDLVEDLGFDSYSMVQLIADIEDSFEIEFDMNILNLSVLRFYKNLCETIEQYI